MRKHSVRKPKRTSFWKMFVKAMILPLLLTFAAGSSALTIGRHYILYEIDSLNWNDVNRTAQMVERENEYLNGWYKPIEFPLAFSTYRTVTTEGLLSGVPFVLAATYDDPDGAAANWAVNSRGEVVLSNRARMWIVVNEDADNRYYCCFDPSEFDIPEMNELFSQFFEDTQENGIEYEFKIKSLYMNKDSGKMIPHEIEVKKYKISRFASVLEERRYTDTSTVVVDAGYEGFALVELAGHNDPPNKYPRGGFDGIYGVDPVRFDEIYDKYSSLANDTDYTSGMQSMETDGRKYVYDFMSKVNVSSQNKYGVTAVVCVTRVNAMNRFFMRKIWLLTGGIFAITTLIAFLLCWRRNVRNKAQYAFEDYQRSLINNLAHDLKTPLAVIGGYAENLQELRESDGSEKELKYISSIMNNVSYTDDIIAKTLQLSETEQIKKLNKTKVDIKAMTERLLGKYLTALDERNIELRTDLCGEVAADEDILSAAVENLISNAVKYTRSDGTVTVTADKKQFCIRNDTAENVDTKDLLMPFVKGDKARSDKRSHGLGLAIASSAAAQNGFGLKVSCKDKVFTAVIRF